MANKKQSDKNTSPEAEQPQPDSTPSSTNDGDHLHYDEVIAGVFYSKRRTGQFDDRFETGELEFHQVFNSPTTDASEAKPESASSADNWADCVVHDLDGHEFDTMDDLMEWPADFDESSEQF